MVNKILLALAYPHHSRVQRFPPNGGAHHAEILDIRLGCIYPGGHPHSHLKLHLASPTTVSPCLTGKSS